MAEDQQRPRRYKVFQPGDYTSGGVSVRMHLLNISEEGARAHSTTPPRVGDRIMVRGVLPLGRAEVMWVDRTAFGIKFALALSADTVRQVVEAEDRFRALLRRTPPIT